MSGLEPLAALGLACSVMQTITFAGQTLSLCKKICNDGQPDPALNDYSLELSKISETLKDNLNRGSGVLSSDELALRDTAEKCLEVATKLAQEMQNLSPQKGKKGFLTSIRLGFKALFRKPRLEELETSLRNIQSAMNTQLLVRTLNRVDASTIEQQGALTDSRRLIEDTIHQCSSKNENKLDLIAQESTETRDQLLEAMNNAQSRMEAHIKSEWSKNTQLLQTIERKTQRQADQFQQWKDKHKEQIAYQRLLQSLKCENMDERKNQITENYPETYHWIFEGMDEYYAEPLLLQGTASEEFQDTPARSSQQLLLPEPSRPQTPPWIFEESKDEFLRIERAREETSGDANFSADFSLAPIPEDQLFFPALTRMSADDGNDELLEDGVFEPWYQPTENSHDPSSALLEYLAGSYIDDPNVDPTRAAEPGNEWDTLISRHRLLETLTYGSENLMEPDSESDSPEELERPWDSFVSWLGSKDPVYWISGKPGSGKSTLMKFVSSNPTTKKLLSMWQPEVQIFSHYFWKAGSEMQQSKKGLLCSLMYQIFCENRQAAVQYLHKTREVRQKPSSIADWDATRLEALLEDYISKSTGGICLFIDGLDEFTPQRDCHDLLFLLDRLSGPRVKLCLSSRPEQVLHNHLQCHANLRMQDLTEDDMRKYAAGYLRRAISPTNQEFDTDVFVDLIVQKADGVFLWVTLVAKSLARGIENGDSDSELRQRLELMPGDLAALYKDMWLRSNDDRDIYQKTASWFFNIISAAEYGERKSKHVQPLPCMRHSLVSVFELMAATDSTVLDRFLEHGDEFPAADLDKRCSRIAKAVETRSAGLLEVSDDYVKSHGPMTHLAQCLAQQGQQNALEHHADTTVRFIHRTARDYLLESEDGRSLWQTSEISPNEARTNLIRACLLRCYIWPFSEAIWRPVHGNELGSFLLSASLTVDRDDSSPKDLILAIERAYESGILWSSPVNRSREAGPTSRKEPKETEAMFILWAGLSGLVGYTVSRISFMRQRNDLDAIIDELLRQFCQGDEKTKHEDRGPLIRCLLQQGASPNTDDATLASPWVLYLKAIFKRVLSPMSARSLARSAPGEIFHTLRAFIEAGASLSGHLPVLVTLASPHLSYGCLTVCPQEPRVANVTALLVSVNRTWLINEILEHLDAEAKTASIGHESVPPSAKAVMAIYEEVRLEQWHRCWRIQDEDAYKIADELFSRLRSSAKASPKVQKEAMRRLHDMILEVKGRSELVEEDKVPGFLRAGKGFYPGW